MTRSPKWLADAFTLLLPASVAWAQLSTAQLSGRVTDESGAVLPGATITVMQAEKGLHPLERDRRGRNVCPAEPAARSVSARGSTAGVSHLRADTDRAAGRSVAGRQRRPVGRYARGVGHRARRRPARRCTELRDQRRRPERGDPGAGVQYGAPMCLEPSQAVLGAPASS